MDIIVQKLVAMGVPGLIFLGIAALITALSVMGGPFGLIGGVAAIGLLALTVDAVAEYGVEEIGKQIVKGLQKEGLAKSDINKKIDSYSLVSESLKKKMKEMVYAS